VEFFHTNNNPYTLIQDYFLAHWVSLIGIGPAMLYIQLLSYCHKGKDTAWPSIKTLNTRMVLPQSYRKENDGEEKITKIEQMESESKVIKPEKITLENKPEEEKKDYPEKKN